MLDAVVPSIVDDMRSCRDDVGNDEEDDEQLDELVKAPTTSDDANAITAATAHNTAMTTTPINVDSNSSLMCSASSQPSVWFEITWRMKKFWAGHQSSINRIKGQWASSLRNLADYLLVDTSGNHSEGRRETWLDRSRKIDVG